MAFIRTIADIKKKWATVTPTRSGDYEYGVSNPRRDWEKATVSAEDAYKTGVQQAIQKGRFAKGVRKEGTEKWRRGAETKGVQRWGPGVALAEDDYAQGFGPYREAIERTTLPPRYAKRDPRNLERVKKIVEALSKTKEAQLGT